MASASVFAWALACAWLPLICPQQDSTSLLQFLPQVFLQPQGEAMNSVSAALSTVITMRGAPYLIYANSSSDPFEKSLAALKSIDRRITRACSASYGKGMLTGLRLTVHQVCVPQPVPQNELNIALLTDAKASRAPKVSSIECHERVPFDVPRYMCELKNVKISQDGTLANGCAISDWAANANFGVAENSVFQLDGIVQNTSLDCQDSMARKALVQFPWDTNNFYEWYGDWVTLWETLAALKWNPKELDMFLVVEDSLRSKRRPFDSAWQLAFQQSHVHIGSKKELFGNGKCFSHVATVPHGGLSTESFQGGRGGEVQCPSPTMMASAVYLQSISRVEYPIRQTTQRQVTLLMRTGSRAFVNEETTTDALMKAIPEGWKLSVYRPENIQSLSEQLAIAAGTDVLVGVHGAGMTHVLFLPPRARVVEVFCGDRGRSNHHFRNLEAMGDEIALKSMSSYYFPLSPGACTLDTDVVLKAIRAFGNDNMQ